MTQARTIEYICTYCGRRTTRSATSGRPMPGQCPRKPKNRAGDSRPHTWVVNRRF